MHEAQQQLCDQITQRGESMLRDMAEHVAIPTGRGHTPGLDQYRAEVARRLQGLGAMTQLVPGAARPQWLSLPGASAAFPEAPPAMAIPETSPPPTLIARSRAHGRGPRILIVGHLDTVHDPHGPFQTLSIAADRKTAVGPGAADMKGGIVIALHALEALRDLGVPVAWTFALNSDEETGSFHSVEALEAAAREHDIGLVLEPALPDGSLVVQRMGAGQFRIEVFGRSAHVGRDFQRGVSAVNRLAQIILEVSNLTDAQQGVIVNVGPLQGGAVTNAVADYAACWGNVRFRDRETAQRLAARFDALATPADAMPRVVVHQLFNRPAKPLTPAVQSLAERARTAAQDLGQNLPFASTGGVCDGNILQEAGLATIDTLGVRGGNLHRDDEYIELPSLVERCQLLAVLMLRLSASG